jgi:prepilin signal peptidase PulO-like enzyme (type II secretory pathway)
MSGLISLAGAILASVLAALSYTDLKTFRLPDKLTFPLIAAGLGQAYLLGLPLLDHAIGAALGYAAFVAIEKTFLKLRGYHGLGRGDAKLLAGGGAWCGWFGLPYIVLLSSLAGLSLLFAGLITGRVKKDAAATQAIPFGPFLAASIFIVWAGLIARPLMQI